MRALRERIGPLGLGGAALGNLYGAVSDSQARETALAALQAGIGYIDTAPHYGFGLSERRIGDVLADYDPNQRVVVSTKVGRVLQPTPEADLSVARQGFVSPEPYESAFDYSYDGVMRSWEASRLRLRRDRIDILYVHDLGARTHDDDHPRLFRSYMDGGYRALRELRDGGAVDAIGLGVNEWEICIEAMDAGQYDLVLLAGRYTLIDQGALDQFLPLCAEKEVSVVIGGPYNSGILATGVREKRQLYYDYAQPTAELVTRVAAIEDVCDAHGVPLAAAALQFPLGHPQVAAVIPGLASPAQVLQTEALMSFAVPAAFWDDLKQRGLLRRDVPTPL